MNKIYLQLFSIVRVGEANPMQIKIYNASQDRHNTKEQENTCEQKLFKALFRLRLCLVLRKSGGKKVKRKKNGKEKKFERK